MLGFQRSNSVDFPRQKIYLSSLTSLIDRRPVMQPEVEVNNKLFPQRSFAKKLAITHHQRIKSSLETKPRKFDVHWTSKKVKNLVVENNRSPTTQTTRRDRLMLLPAQSVQLANSHIELNPCANLRFSQTLTSSPQSYPNSERPDSPQKNFLRKGSNLQKQIVINLLRSKLLKQRELSEKKQYSNNEILKMIQVFKGVALDSAQKKKGLVWDGGEKLHCQQKRTDHYKEIKGWDNQPQMEFEDTEQK